MSSGSSTTPAPSTAAPERPRHRLATLVALVAVMVAHVVLSLAPGDWDPPVRVSNAAVRDGRALDLPAPGMATVPSTAVQLPRGSATTPVTLELVVRSGGDQAGPARILSLSSDVRHQSLMVGQQDDSLVVRVRRPGSTAEGRPALVTRHAFARPGLHRITVAITSGEITTTVDGRPGDSMPSPGPVVDTWDDAHELVLGNEHGGIRPWRGRIERAVLSTGTTTDLLAVAELPDRYWALPSRWLGPPAWNDPWAPDETQLLHALALAVIAGLATLLVPRRPLAVAAGCWLFSATVFVAKLFAGGRHPSLADLLVEATAAALAVTTVAAVSRSRRRAMQATAGARRLALRRPAAG